MLVSNQKTESCLTQLAYGELDSGEIIESHKHSTMEEYFYFIDGNGRYIVSEKSYDISPGCHIMIPSNTMHSLMCDGDGILKFIYFGIAL